MPSTRSSWPIWCPLRISRCSVRVARLSCPMAPGNGRNRLASLFRVLVGLIFRVYRATLLLLDVAILDNYGEMVRSQSFLYDDAWSVVCNADVQVRSERFERMHRRAEREHAEPPAASRIATLASRGRQCSRWPSRTESCGISTRTSPPSSTSLGSSRLPLPWKMALHRPALERRGRTGTRDRCRGSRKHQRRSQESSGLVYSRCDEFKATAGCPRSTLWATACRVAHLQALAPRHHHLQLERRSGTRQRGRRSKTGGTDISRPPRTVEAFGGRPAGNAGTRAWRRTAGSVGPSDTQVCVLPGPTGLAFVQGVSTASRQPRHVPTVVAGRLRRLGSHRFAPGCR